MQIRTLNIFDVLPHYNATGSTPAFAHLSTHPIDLNHQNNSAQGQHINKQRKEFGAMTRPQEVAGSYKAKEATRSLQTAARLNLLAQRRAFADFPQTAKKPSV